MTASPDPPATADAAIAPVTAGERVSSVDVLRGFSLLGILWMNIVGFGLPGAAYPNPTVAGGTDPLNMTAWLLSAVLVEGKMRTIFSLLFGAGVILLTSRAERRGAEAGIADTYYRRTLWLIGFGLLHAYFIWIGDILFFYGVSGLLLYPFRKQSPKFLITAGLCLLACMVPMILLEVRNLESMRDEAGKADALTAAGKKLTEEQLDAQRTWKERLEEWQPPPKKIEEQIETHRAGYWKIFTERRKLVSEGQPTLYYNWFLFDVTGMMLLGMGLLKLGVLSAQRSYRFYWLMALFGFGLGVPITWYAVGRQIASGFDLPGSFLSLTVYDLDRLLIATGYVGLVMLVCKSGVLRPLTSRLAAVGQMALTNYLMHSLICTTFFYGYGLGMFGRLQRHQLFYVVAAIWLVQLVLSPLWLRRFRFGPMEWVWRSLTHWKRQPMRLAIPVSPRAQRAVPAI